MKRRQFLGASILATTACSLGGAQVFAKARRKPNFIIVLCDDLGYGDIEPTGGKSIPTPNIDRMAREGTVLTDYYAPANICTPSRAGMLTGRYPIRTGLGYQVILEGDKRGLPLTEVTIAQALKPAGYVSGLFGKWHLGHVAPYWPPTGHGFDKFFGIPYSHDMHPLSLFEDNGPGTDLIERPVDFPHLQQSFYEHAERFIVENADKPFFVELALSAPHLPNYPNPDQTAQPTEGDYGQVVQEIDTIVGKLLAKLQSLGLDRDTLVIFTSDNGPWYEGSSGGLRSRKGGAGYDGGYRVPCIVRQPGTIPAGARSDSIAMGIDFLPTFCALANIPPPAGVKLDGLDLSAVLTHGAPSPHDALILFDNEDVLAIRTQRWKYVVGDYYRGFMMATDNRGSPQLYDMKHDISESYSAASRNPDVLHAMQNRVQQAREQFAPLKAKSVPEPFKTMLKQYYEHLQQD